MKKIILFFLGILMITLSMAKSDLLTGRENFQPFALIQAAEQDREVRLIKYTSKLWQNNNWYNNLSIDFFYNDQGLVEKYMVYYWNGMNWVLDHRELLSYDQNQNIIEILIEIQNGPIWEAYLRYQVSYNDNNDISEQLIQYWDAGWVNDILISFYYNDLDQMIEQLVQIWSNSDWQNDYRTLQSFDAQGDPIEGLDQIWVIDEWQDDYLMTREFEDHNFIEGLGQINYLGDWENDVLLNYEYNDNDDQIYGLMQVWENENWHNEQQDSLFYDDQGNILTELSHHWNSDSLAWINSSLIEYFYEEVHSSQEAIPELNSILSNHPNPFNPSTTISFSLTTKSTENTKIIIYNLKGQKIRTLECIDCVDAASSQMIHSIIWNGQDENNKSVSSGVYFYQLQVDGKLFASQKMLLMK